MHRVKDVAGATTKVFAAAKAAAGRGKVVRKRHVEEALESLFPKDESASPGPKRGSTPKAAAKPRNTPTDGPLEVPDFAVSETRLKAALQRMTAVLQGEEVGTAWMIAAATAKCCTDYGTAATSAAIQSLAPKAAKAAKPRAKRTAAK